MPRNTNTHNVIATIFFQHHSQYNRLTMMFLDLLCVTRIAPIASIIPSSHCLAQLISHSIQSGRLGLVLVRHNPTNQYKIGWARIRPTRNVLSYYFIADASNTHSRISRYSDYAATPHYQCIYFSGTCLHRPSGRTEMALVFF